MTYQEAREGLKKYVAWLRGQGYGPFEEKRQYILASDIYDVEQELKNESK